MNFESSSAVTGAGATGCELKPVEMEFEKAFAEHVVSEFPSKVVLMVFLYHPFPT
jgi:hypothetical protein